LLSYHLLFCVLVMWAVGAVVNMRSESWLLKGVLLAFFVFLNRRLSGQDLQKQLPSISLVASVFWMVVTWFLWFLPDILLIILFALTITALLYYYFRSCRTDPGIVKATEEEKKKNVVVLAEAGCLDPRIFCTSCMMRKPMRANHCFSCDACIAKQDHHSVWINNCIGARNHHFFVLFLLCLCFLTGWIFYGSIVCKLQFLIFGTICQYFLFVLYLGPNGIWNLSC
uniref:Palmitoyltransferase n=1 Tax=Denticeps clupeoides TaxID=299321 RepID=A0AAY4EWB7_9TELE